MARNFEPIFSSDVKVAPTHSPPVSVGNVAEPFIPPSTLTGSGSSAEKHQPASQAVVTSQFSSASLPGTGFSAEKHQPASKAVSSRPTSTSKFTGQGFSAKHQPTSQTKGNRPPPAGDNTGPTSKEDHRLASTDRPLSSEPADTGSPALYRSRRDSILSCHLMPTVSCLTGLLWIYMQKRGSFLRIRTRR